MSAIKRCDLSSDFYRKLETFVQQHTVSNFHHINVSYWINICFRVGLACIKTKHIGLDKFLMRENEYSADVHVVSIDAETYNDLKNFVQQQKKSGRQLINYWLNITCEVGFECIIERKIDMTSYFLGIEPTTCLIKKDNLKILPLTETEKKITEVIPQQLLTEPQPIKLTNNSKKVRSSNYDATENEQFAQMFNL